MAAAIKATDKAVQAYYDELARYGGQGVGHEMALRSAFQNLLAETAKKRKWTLVPELPTKICGELVRPNGTMRDDEWQSHPILVAVIGTFGSLEGPVQVRMRWGRPGCSA